MLCVTLGKFWFSRYAFHFLTKCTLTGHHVVVPNICRSGGVSLWAPKTRLKDLVVEILPSSTTKVQHNLKKKNYVLKLFWTSHTKGSTFVQFFKVFLAYPWLVFNFCKPLSLQVHTLRAKHFVCVGELWITRELKQPRRRQGGRRPEVTWKSVRKRDLRISSSSSRRRRQKE